MLPADEPDGHSLSGMLTVYDYGTDGVYASGLILGTVNGSHLILWTTGANLKSAFAPVAEATLYGATITVTYQEAGAGATLTRLSLRPATVADYNRQVVKV